jgi:hypothetical protein
VWDVPSCPRDARALRCPSRLAKDTQNERPTQNETHSTLFSGKGYHRSSKASRHEDLQVEEPVSCEYSAAFHFHATLAGMLSPTLITDGVSLSHTREFY